MDLRTSGERKVENKFHVLSRNVCSIFNFLSLSFTSTPAHLKGMKAPTGPAFCMKSSGCLVDVHHVRR